MSSYKKVVWLYEQFIQLPALRDLPVLTEWELGGIIMAAFHGLELQFLLLEDILVDRRPYVDHEQRLRGSCNDMISQLQLISRIFDNRVMYDLRDHCRSTPMTTDSGLMQKQSRVSVAPLWTSSLPFTQSTSCSPSLEALIRILESDDQNIDLTIVKCHLRPVIDQFFTLFRDLPFGLGLDDQLTRLLNALGAPLPQCSHRIAPTVFLDYTLLVRPDDVRKTKSSIYEMYEEYFFANIHLGTECWAHILKLAIKRAVALASDQDWQSAKDMINVCSDIFNYMGQHIQLLAHMNNRDYLLLKVALEGTSGAGSVAVLSAYKDVQKLWPPLAESAVNAFTACKFSQESVNEENHVPVSRESDFEALSDLERSILHIYYNPEKHSDLYSYCQGLQHLETALLSGFFSKHYELARTILGSGANGTINRSVDSLRVRATKPLFPTLDVARVWMSAFYDNDKRYVKGSVLSKFVSAGTEQSLALGLQNSA